MLQCLKDQPWQENVAGSMSEVKPCDSIELLFKRSACFPRNDADPEFGQSLSCGAGRIHAQQT